MALKLGIKGRTLRHTYTHLLTHSHTHLDQLSPVLAVRANTVDDLGQVDSSGQVIVGQERSDCHQVVIATSWINLLTQLNNSC